MKIFDVLDKHTKCKKCGKSRLYRTSGVTGRGDFENGAARFSGQRESFDPQKHCSCSNVDVQSEPQSEPQFAGSFSKERRVLYDALQRVGEIADTLPIEYQIAISDEVGELFLGTIFLSMAEFVADNEPAV